MTRIIALIYLLYSLSVPSQEITFNDTGNYYNQIAYYYHLNMSADSKFGINPYHNSDTHLNSDPYSNLDTGSNLDSNTNLDNNSNQNSGSCSGSAPISGPASDSAPNSGSSDAPKEESAQITMDINYIDELKTLGFYKEESKDEKLNQRNAILRFQSYNNMDVSGTWDESCMNILINQLNENCFTSKDCINAPPVTGKWITINKTKRILTLYENKNVIKKYPVAIGNPPSLTPSEKFTLVSRVKNPAWGGGGYAKPVRGGSPKNPLGYRWMGLSYKNGSRLGIHGNNSPYSIGKNVSHGCIRMINSDVEELFNLVQINIPVWIGTEKELANWGILQENCCEPTEQDF